MHVIPGRDLEKNWPPTAIHQLSDFTHGHFKDTHCSCYTGRVLGHTFTAIYGYNVLQNQLQVSSMIEIQHSYMFQEWYKKIFSKIIRVKIKSILYMPSIVITGRTWVGHGLSASHSGVPWRNGLCQGEGSTQPTSHRTHHRQMLFPTSCFLLQGVDVVHISKWFHKVPGKYYGLLIPEPQNHLSVLQLPRTGYGP